MKDWTPRQAKLAAAVWLAAYLVGAVLLPDAADGTDRTDRDKAQAAHDWAMLPVCLPGQTEGCRQPARCETDGECAELDNAEPDPCGGLPPVLGPEEGK